MDTKRLWKAFALERGAAAAVPAVAGSGRGTQRQAEWMGVPPVVNSEPFYFKSISSITQMRKISSRYIMVGYMPLIILASSLFMSLIYQASAVSTVDGRMSIVILCSFALSATTGQAIL